VEVFVTSPFEVWTVFVPFELVCELPTAGFTFDVDLFPVPPPDPPPTFEPELPLAPEVFVPPAGVDFVAGAAVFAGAAFVAGADLAGADFFWSADACRVPVSAPAETKSRTTSRFCIDLRFNGYTRERFMSYLLCSCRLNSWFAPKVDQEDAVGL
jgi:hypothetical protein